MSQNIDNIYRGFVRDPNGNLTVFDVPNAVETLAFSINASGNVTGYFADTNDKSHGFVRDPNGNFTVFDVPNAVQTYVTSINDRGDIAGWFTDASQGDLGRSFVRFVDNTPPTTTAIPSPSPNINGWNNTNVTVNLNATDNPGGSGVKQIQFALGGAQNTGWETVAGNAASVTISAEGTTILSYFATDNAGNQETTKTLTVRIDKTPPTSKVSTLPATEPSASFPVQWSGTDAGSGIQNFTIYASNNGGPFAPWLTNTTATQATYTGVEGHTYGFYSIARDLAGDVEKPKSVADATTLVPNVSLSLWENTTMGLGQTVELPVTISKPAPSGGVTVTLISSDPSKVTVVTPIVFFPVGWTVPKVEPKLTGVNLGGGTSVITQNRPYIIT